MPSEFDWAWAYRTFTHAATEASSFEGQYDFPIYDQRTKRPPHPVAATLTIDCDKARQFLELQIWQRNIVYELRRQIEIYEAEYKPPKKSKKRER